MKKVSISGIKPTGRPHIGNYFGAMRQFVAMQDEYESNVFIPDFHALTSVTNPAELHQNIIDVAIDYLSIGLDPNKVTLFKQSDVPEVTEAAWIFECLTTMPYLMRSHAFKDAEAKNKDINVGVFNYPILMAADILLSNADVVPVGSDQKQHVEIARDTAIKFNRVFGTTFKLPQELIVSNVATIPGIDGQKMSKSYKNTIALFATKDEIKKAVMSIETDSAGPTDPKNTSSTLFRIHQLFLDSTGQKELAEQYKNGISYKEAKENLVRDINTFIEPLREKREAWKQKQHVVIDLVHDGGRRAQARAQHIMDDVRKKIGISFK